MRILDFLRNNIAIATLAWAYIASCVAIYNTRLEEAPPGYLTLTLAHWQLEPGVHQGVDELAREYEKLHPNVRIVQTAIPEGVYGQWITTQMIGGTAPDIVQCGLGLPPAIWRTYYARYFVPMSPIVGQPNPYNRGTELEGVPLRMTYKDGMRGSYIEDLMEFMTIPMAQHAIRVFYNRDLLQKLTGSDAPPANYAEFVRICEAIAAQKDSRGFPYVPIAGSEYHFNLWENAVPNPLTYGVLFRSDLNRDGKTNKDELFTSFKMGLVDFHFPPIEAKFKVVRTLSDFFQTGFIGLTRDDGVLLFAQQRSVDAPGGRQISDWHHGLPDSYPPRSHLRKCIRRSALRECKPRFRFGHHDSLQISRGGPRLPAFHGRENI